MSKWIIWRHGPRGPTPALLNDLSMDEYDRSNKITNPVKLKPEEENLPFSELTKLYPAPKPEDK